MAHDFAARAILVQRDGLFFTPTPTILLRCTTTCMLSQKRTRFIDRRSTLLWAAYWGKLLRVLLLRMMALMAVMLMMINTKSILMVWIAMMMVVATLVMLMCTMMQLLWWRW